MFVVETPIPKVEYFAEKPKLSEYNLLPQLLS